MQISLNNEDWHSVPIIKKSFSFTYYESPHIVKLNPPYGPVKHKGDLVMDIEGSNFKCPEPTCSDLLVRFGEPGTAIYQKGQRVSDSLIRVKVPKYSKPEVLRVEVTVNGKDWSNDGKTYGYFDPYVLRAEPALISVDGTTKIRVIGFGFVNSTTSKSMVRSPSGNTLVCQGKSCVRDAVFINQNTIETTVYPQALINYKENDQGIMWDPMSIDASIHGESLSDFTDNGVQIFFYEEPDFKELTIDESPANIQSQIYIITDFKKNPIDRLKKYANLTCRFKGEDGKVAYS
jgi:IPT/TIG domain